MNEKNPYDGGIWGWNRYSSYWYYCLVK
jgi:hypothetical protein